MNGKAQVGFVFIIIFLLVAIMAFAFIEPLKESLDNNRGGSTLNCPGTPDFDQNNYDSQKPFEKLTYRTTCAATGFSLVYFIGMILIAGVIWVYKSWSGK